MNAIPIHEANFSSLIPHERWRGSYLGIPFDITRYETFGVWFWGFNILLNSNDHPEVSLDISAYVDSNGDLHIDPFLKSLPFKNDITHYDEVVTIQETRRIVVGTDYTGPGFVPERQNLDIRDLASDAKLVISAYRLRFPYKGEK